MGALFGKPSKPSPPPLPPPEPTPEVAPESEEYAMRAAKKKRGFMSTVRPLLESSGGKKTLLG